VSYGGIPQTPVFGLYGQTWGKLLAPGVKHPAKFSVKLVRWIYQHGLDMGYWRRGDLILDPFAGVGCGGIIALEYGMRWLGVELETSFVRMSEENFAHAALTNPAWELLRADDMPWVLQGDSRHLREVIAAASGAITSPPYSEGLGHWQAYRDPYDKEEVSEPSRRIHEERSIIPGNYGATPGQIGRLPMGALTSPGYGNRVDDHGTDKPEYDIVEKMGDYGPLTAADGQIGVMRAAGSVTSPLFTPADTRDRHPVQDGSVSEVMARSYTVDTSSPSEGNIGQLAIEKEDYWSACSAVYRGLFELLPSGSVACVVVKDFVKARKRVNLCDMTLEVLVSVGFIPLERTFAMLWDIKADGTRVERKSFFRRVAEKNGSPPIDWEECLWVLRP
jgi:hypothetical protein